MVRSLRRVRPCFVVFFLLIARVTFGADPPAVLATKLPAGTAAPVVDGLVTDAAPKDREAESAKARERAAKRFAVA